MASKVNVSKCIGCGACESTCPVGAIKIKNNKSVVDAKKCIGCGACCGVCPTGAIKLEK